MRSSSYYMPLIGQRWIKCGRARMHTTYGSDRWHLTSFTFYTEYNILHSRVIKHHMFIHLLYMCNLNDICSVMESSSSVCGLFRLLSFASMLLYTNSSGSSSSTLFSCENGKQLIAVATRISLVIHPLFTHFVVVQSKL